MATGIDRETIEAIARIAPDTLLTIQVRAGDLAAAFVHATPGPEVMTPEDASTFLGYPAHRWSRWCREGRIAGALKQGRGWRFPKESARQWLDALMNKGSTKRRRRGPWKIE